MWCVILFNYLTSKRNVRFYWQYFFRNVANLVKKKFVLNEFIFKILTFFHFMCRRKVKRPIKTNQRSFKQKTSV